MSVTDPQGRVTSQTDHWGTGTVLIMAFDRAGLAASRTLRVTILPVADLLPPRVAFALQGDQSVVGFAADLYSRWHLETSTDLVEWKVENPEIECLGTVQLPVRLSLESSQEFFRFRQVAP